MPDSAAGPVLAPRRIGLDDCTLAVVDLGAPEDASYLAGLAARLEQRHFLSAVVPVAGPEPGERWPTEAIVGPSHRYTAAVVGVCRSAYSVRTVQAAATALESAGVPCAVVVVGGLEPRDGSPGVATVPAGATAAADIEAMVEASFRSVERALCREQPPSGKGPQTWDEVTCAC